MSITFRKLTENDLEQFISLRIAQLREEGATEKIDLIQINICNAASDDIVFAFK